MIRKRGARRLGVVTALALTAGLVATVPASAAPTNPGGSVNLRDLLAGQTRTFEISVTHNGNPGGGIGPLATPPDDDINFVVITPPIDLIDPSTVQGPGDWSGRVTGDPSRVVFEGDTLSPGGTAIFQIVGDVERPATDDGDDWLVRVSDNEGQTTSKATGNLFTNIRVLQVQAVSIVAPQGATNLTVTATQDNVCARTRVFNAGSATLDVTPTLSASNVTVGQPRMANAASPCSNPPISSAPIVAGGTQEFEFPLTFGSAGTRTLVADASAPGADAFDTNVNVTVQPKAVLSYVGGSLQPRALPPGALGEVFRINVNKTPGGSPAITLDPSDTTFEFDACTPPKELASAGNIGSGSVSNVELAFEACDLLQGVGNGKYDVAGTYGYMDANDFVQDLTDLNIGDQINLDDLIPDVDVRLIPPDNRVDANQPGAISRGNAFTIEVDVFDTNPETGQLEPCGASNGVDGCSIEESGVEFYDSDGNVIGTHPVAMNNTNGFNSVSVTLQGEQIPTGSVQARAFARAEDDPGNSTLLERSLPEDVDLIAPEILRTETSPAMNRREVAVTFTEPVRFGLGDFSHLDWTVEVDGEDNRVTNVRRPSDEEGQTDFRRAVLTVERSLPCDLSQTPDGQSNGNVRYELFEDPLNLTGNNRGHDRVGLELADQTAALLDGISPLAPIVKQVQGRDEQVGKFWFNDRQPATTAGNEDDGADCLAVSDGYTLELYEDTTGDGQFDPGPGGDTLLATVDADDLEATFTDYEAAFVGEPTELGRTEAKVFVRAFDTNMNPTPVADVTAAAVDFVFDEVAPTIVGATVIGDDITVEFDEDVAFGRDFSVDWRLLGVKPNRTRDSEFEIGSVSGGPDHRMLHANDPDFGPSISDIRVAYEYLGPAANRYTDRAGNFLGDALVSAS